MGIVANNYGRKMACILSLVLGGVGTILIGFSPNYWTSLAMYGLAGFQYPFMSFCTLIINEIGDNDYRILGAGAIQIAWAIMELIFVLIGFEIRNWRSLVIIAGVPLRSSILLTPIRISFNHPSNITPEILTRWPY